MTRFLIIFVFLISFGAYSGITVAECQSSDSDYEKAITKFWSIHEVNKWKNFIQSNGKKSVATQSAELQLLHGKCFYSITAYVDEGTHLHRWHFFLISQKEKVVLLDDSEGDFIPIAKWRKTQEGMEWNP